MHVSDIEYKISCVVGEGRDVLFQVRLSLG